MNDRSSITKRVSWKDSSQALKEVVTVLVFTILPTVLVAVFLSFNGSRGVWQCFLEILEVKELYVMTVSFLAPVFWIVNRERENLPEFPGKFWSNLLLFVFLMVAMIVVVALSIRLSPQGAAIDSARGYAAVCTFISLIILYIFTMINNAFSRKLPDVDGAMEDSRKKQTDLSKGLRNRKGKP